MTPPRVTAEDRGCRGAHAHRHLLHDRTVCEDAHHHHDAWCLPYDLWPQDVAVQDLWAACLLGQGSHTHHRNIGHPIPPGAIPIRGVAGYWRDRLQGTGPLAGWPTWDQLARLTHDCPDLAMVPHA